MPLSTFLKPAWSNPVWARQWQAFRSNRRGYWSLWLFLFLFILISVIATLLLTLFGVDILTSASTVISSMANVGPALGDAGPSENYYSIPAAGKWVLIMCMLIGRLEIYTVIVLFMPLFWKK